MQHDEYWATKSHRAAYRRSTAGAYSAVTTALEHLRRGENELAARWLTIALDTLDDGRKNDV